VIFKSPVYSQASGSIAGIVYSRNAGGMYTRARAMPTNPNTDAQQAVRSAMAALVDQWSNVLTNTQRENWNTYAFNTPTLNRIGEPTHKTGQNMFIRGNIPRIQAGLPIAVAAPTTFDIGEFTPVVGITGTSGTNQLSIPFTVADEWANEDDSALLVYQSRPQNATRTFGKGPFQLVTIIAGDATTPPTSPKTATSLFPLAFGQKLFFQLRVSRVDGRLSGKQNPTAICT